MSYRFYDVRLILDKTQKERLEQLEKRFKKINGWGKTDILEFALNSLRTTVDISLEFAEIKVSEIEKDGIVTDAIKLK